MPVRTFCDAEHKGSRFSAHEAEHAGSFGAGLHRHQRWAKVLEIHVGSHTLQFDL